ncbi:MAG: hypothetical protein ACRCT8_12640 [Lacipirellulaceae bacterium]
MNALKFNRDHQAAFFARAHIEADPAICEVWHALGGAGDREVRLIEVNTMLGALRDDCLEPIEFTIDRGLETMHRLCVLDVTVDQWNRMQSNALSPPLGWSLDGAVRVQPRRP